MVTPSQKTNVYAVDALTGALVWKAHVDNHLAARITGSPQLAAGVAYVPVSSFEEVIAPAPKYECCSFRGSVVALDAATGQVIWKTYTIADTARATTMSKTGVQQRGPSGAAIWSTPTLDTRRGVLYVSTGNNYSEPTTTTSDAVLALDAATGALLWTKQLVANDAENGGCGIPGKPMCPEADGPDADFGQPPILVTLRTGKRALVIGQKSGMVHALDPDRRGAILWQTRVARGGKLGGSQWGSAADGRNVYVASSDLQLKTVSDSSPQRFHFAPDPTAGGGLTAVDLATGKVAWKANATLVCGSNPRCSPAQSATVTAIPGIVFSGAIDGHLRAYTTASGTVVWDLDANREFATVNGPAAHGGSFDAGGVAVADGMVFVSSGYGLWGGMPGNVLLAFAVAKR
jgi:polyvinyl alcohol dehydrogenase (cytochrome)